VREGKACLRSSSSHHLGPLAHDTPIDASREVKCTRSRNDNDGSRDNDVSAGNHLVPWPELTRGVVEEEGVEQGAAADDDCFLLEISVRVTLGDRLVWLPARLRQPPALPPFSLPTPPLYRGLWRMSSSTRDAHAPMSSGVQRGGGQKGGG